MPMSPFRPCNRVGCPGLVGRSERYCPEHERERRQAEDARKPEWHRLYRTARWQQLRKRKLFDAPLCERCGTIATLVHHRTPHNGDAVLFHDYCNLESLCVRCHEAEHRRMA